jgi:crotonobetainyl-CoA:carnitine CoA-transferase CaiB-like acyl-CoA transferase
VTTLPDLDKDRRTVMAEPAEHKGVPKPPLDGVFVLEYGVFHAGPGACAILGDLGAEVVKIEDMTGDPERYWTNLGHLNIAMPNGESAMFQFSNRNKRSICLDIQPSRGRQIFEQLVARADVFLTNLRQSTKKKLGIDYEALRGINPRMIHANVSGYGPEGPMADLGAFDPMGLARSGMMFVTGREEPKLMHLGILDQATAIGASHAILTALFVRERSGLGQEVHVSLYSVGQWLTAANLTIHSLLGIDPIIPAIRTDHSPLRNRYRCKDGKWIICTHHPEEKYWSIFCETTGQAHLLSDPRFADEKSRAANGPALIEILDEIFAKRTSAEWMEVFVARGLMFCPVQRVGEIKDDPQALANRYMVDFQDPALGSLRIPGYPIQFSDNSAGTRSLAPSLGQHTIEVMEELGYSDQEIDDLKRDGVIR